MNFSLFNFNVDLSSVSGLIEATETQFKPKPIDLFTEMWSVPHLHTIFYCADWLGDLSKVSKLYTIQNSIKNVQLYEN